MGFFDSINSRDSIDLEKRYVVKSAEFLRILNLPYRKLNINIDLTDQYKTDGGTQKLRPIQSAALQEAKQNNGLFAPIPVGYGKTLISLLLPSALSSKKACLLVKAQLRKQLESVDIPFYEKHFKLPLNIIKIISYEQLSSQGDAGILDEEQPDLIIADEAHCLKRRQSARTKRFLRFFRENPSCRFCALSGTMTVRSLLDYGHLIELALRSKSPLPVSWYELQTWAGVLDVKPDNPCEPGALMELWPEGTPRERFQQRLIQSPGVITTSEETIKSSLLIKKWKIPSPCKYEYTRAKNRWEIGSGDDLVKCVDALEHCRLLRQLSLGFYYRYEWPEGAPDEKWLRARSEWSSKLTQVLKRGKSGMDSPGLIIKAAEEKRFTCSEWENWLKVRDRLPPKRVTIWVNKFLWKDVFRWIRSIPDGEKGIIWYSTIAPGLLISQCCGLTLCSPKVSPLDVDMKDEKAVVVSLQAHGTGKNMQKFNHQLFLTPPPNGATFEQAIGRCHRLGQLADEVHVTWLCYTDIQEKDFESAISDSKYSFETTGQSKRLLYGTHLSYRNFEIKE